jgi:hypothetical protein
LGLRHNACRQSYSTRWNCAADLGPSGGLRVYCRGCGFVSPQLRDATPTDSAQGACYRHARSSGTDNQHISQPLAACLCLVKCSRHCWHPALCAAVCLHHANLGDVADACCPLYPHTLAQPKQPEKFDADGQSASIKPPMRKQLPAPLHIQVSPRALLPARALARSPALLPLALSPCMSPLAHSSRLHRPRPAYLCIVPPTS